MPDAALTKRSRLLPKKTGAPSKRSRSFAGYTKSKPWRGIGRVTLSSCTGGDSSTVRRCSPLSRLGSTNRQHVLPKSLLGKAIGYTREQWIYLSRYAEDGHAPIDNNLIERDIRPFCTGRKNWLFSDTAAGARASAVIYSLM